MREACSEALQTAQELVKKLAAEKEALELALQKQAHHHACHVRDFQVLEGNLSGALKQIRAYRDEKAELKSRLHKLVREEKVRAEEAQRACDALSSEVRRARCGSEKLACALQDCLLERRSILSFLTEVFSTPPDTSTLVKPSALQHLQHGREMRELMSNLEVEIHDAAMQLHHMLQRIRDESKYNDAVFDPNVQSFSVEELLHRLAHVHQEACGSLCNEAVHCQTLSVACRVDWRLEKDRYLRLKHLINRKVGQLLKLQKLAKSGAAAASRCSLYHGACA
ncbi:hypothetical protein CSUI_007607 [Cystoisospora suis]|uniref:Uncharacterized protein n=1 Tax=Cystoisospora suis TaxID=483139 RepID=A0A2C6KQA6_9APIC|nr:hypothetical protein CSUI_007607 [Cystoisospora suis]